MEAKHPGRTREDRNRVWRLWAAALACLALGGLPASASAEDGTFLEVLAAPTGTNAKDAAIGDFNADGNPDFAVVNSGSDDISIFRGDGRGRFNEQPTLSSDGDEPSAIVSADFDADGDGDLAVANEGGPGPFTGEVVVFESLGAGGFALADTDSVSGFSDGPEALVVGDLTGGPALDLAASVPNNEFVRVLEGDGTGSFSAVQDINVIRGVGDPNGDNASDLLAAGRFGGENAFRTALWNGSSFDAPIPTPTTLLATAIDSSPFEAPPAHEVAVGTTDDPVTPTMGQVELFQDGTPPLGAYATIPVGDGAPTDIEVSEFNSDPFLDLAVTANDTNGTENSTRVILLNDGSGNFAVGPEGLAPTLDPQAIKSADLTGDGTSDLVEVRTAPSDEVRVLLGDLDTDLATTLAAPATATVGEPLTYTITVANLGAVDPAHNTIVTQALPPGSSFASGSPGCSPAGAIVTCFLGTIAPSGQGQATVTVVPSVAGAVTSSASADSDAYDAQLANDTDSKGTTVAGGIEPQAQDRVVAAPVDGTVRVKRPGRPFETLAADQEIPLGSLVDARKGRVEIVSEGRNGELRSAIFSEGKFVIGQVGGGKFTVAELAGKFGSCGKAKAGVKAKKGKKKSRTLFANGGGGHRTTGAYGSATVRGTVWRTTDTCEGSRFNTIRGSIAVRDFGSKKKVIVDEGDSYFAKAR